MHFPSSVRKTRKLRVPVDELWKAGVQGGDVVPEALIFIEEYEDMRSVRVSALPSNF